MDMYAREICRTYTLLLGPAHVRRSMLRLRGFPQRAQIRNDTLQAWRDFATSQIQKGLPESPCSTKWNLRRLWFNLQGKLWPGPGPHKPGPKVQAGGARAPLDLTLNRVLSPGIKNCKALARSPTNHVGTFWRNMGGNRSRANVIWILHNLWKTICT